jgi:RHS repeat-associated protein
VIAHGQLASLTLDVPGDDIDSHIASVAATGYRTFYHQGPDESVLAVSDTSGLVEGYSYSAFGETTIWAPDGTTRAASLPGNRFAFQGQIYDPVTGTYSMRAREYQPKWGRFLSPDPLSIASAPSLYSFTGSRPLQARDPSGLRFRVPGGKGGGFCAYNEINCHSVEVFAIAGGYGDVFSGVEFEQFSPSNEGSSDDEMLRAVGVDPNGDATAELDRILSNSPGDSDPTDLKLLLQGTPDGNHGPELAGNGDDLPNGYFDPPFSDKPASLLPGWMKRLMQSYGDFNVPNLALGINFDVNFIAPFLSRGGGCYGLNLEWTSNAGTVLYYFYTPNQSESTGWSIGWDFALNAAAVNGNVGWDGLFTNYVMGIGPMSGSWFLSPDNPGWKGSSLGGGVSLGPVTGGKCDTFYVPLIGGPKYRQE